MGGSFGLIMGGSWLWDWLFGWGVAVYGKKAPTEAPKEPAGAAGPNSSHIFSVIFKTPNLLATAVTLGCAYISAKLSLTPITYFSQI